MLDEQGQAVVHSPRVDGGDPALLLPELQLTATLDLSCTRPEPPPHFNLNNNTEDEAVVCTPLTPIQVLSTLPALTDLVGVERLVVLPPGLAAVLLRVQACPPPPSHLVSREGR